MRNLACRIDRMGPGGRKCSCCNEFHGRHKSKLNRIVRRRLNVHFDKEVKAELSAKD